MTDRRDEILRVAMQMFAERGFKATTVREIGNQTGILSGSLYHHFGSKLDIVDAILAEFCKDVLERYAAIATTEATAVERLRAIARYAFSIVEDHPHSLKILYNDGRQLVSTEPRFGYVADFEQQVKHHWTNLVSAGVRDGDLRGDIDPNLVYRIVGDTISGAVHWFRPSPTRTIERVADDFMDVLLYGAIAR